MKGLWCHERRWRWEYEGSIASSCLVVGKSRTSIVGHLPRSRDPLGSDLVCDVPTLRLGRAIDVLT